MILKLNTNDVKKKKKKKKKKDVYVLLNIILAIYSFKSLIHVCMLDLKCTILPKEEKPCYWRSASKLIYVRVLFLVRLSETAACSWISTAACSWTSLMSESGRCYTITFWWNDETCVPQSSLTENRNVRVGLGSNIYKYIINTTFIHIITSTCMYKHLHKQSDARL